jgi:hypothetical protein
MATQEYQEELIRKGCPAVGIARNVKIHNAAKRRRAVLRTLVSWWVGAQPGREMWEIHRRFYYRFGVDIGTAFTLKEQETQGLIDRIKARYTEDIVV